MNLVGCSICHSLHLGENPFHLAGRQIPVSAYLDELSHVDNGSVEWRDEAKARALRLLFSFRAEIFPVLQRHLHDQSPRLSPLLGTLDEVGAENSSGDTGKSSNGGANESASGGIEWHSLVGLLGGFLVGYLGAVIIGLWWLDLAVARTLTIINRFV